MDAAYFVLGGMPMSNPGHAGEAMTFVVRLWRETDAAGHAHWRGRVEHVGTEEVGYVANVADVACFIERWTRVDELGKDIRPCVA